MPLAVPKAQDEARLADWAELRILADDLTGVTADHLSRLLRGEAIDLAAHELQEEEEKENEEGELDEDVEVAFDEQEDFDRDARVEILLEEIRFRRRVGETLYPFRVEGERIVRGHPCGQQVYLLLLVLGSSEAPFRADRRAHEVEATFDAIALAALRRYLGRSAEGVRFARNAHDPEDENTRPGRFSEAIGWLRDVLDVGPGTVDPPDDEFESHWESAGRVALGREPLDTYSDAGVDVVVWWRFADRRAGSPVLLAQCTVQLAWERKVNDISVERWKKWVDFKTVPPQTALVIPFAERLDDPHWEERTVDAGVILDRRRLLELLGELPCEDLEGLVDDETAEWVRRELGGLS